MKKLALLISIIAGVAGCEASVQSRPTYARSEPGPRPEPRPQPGPGYQPAPPPPPVAQERWVTLANGYSADASRQFINIKGQDAFRRIRIEPTRGQPMFKQIAIEFADQGRETQVVKIDSQLPGGQTIDLNGGRRGVNRIIVYTAPEAGGSYSVFGG